MFLFVVCWWSKSIRICYLLKISFVLFCFLNHTWKPLMASGVWWHLHITPWRWWIMLHHTVRKPLIVPFFSPAASPWITERESCSWMCSSEGVLANLIRMNKHGNNIKANEWMNCTLQLPAHLQISWLPHQYLRHVYEAWAARNIHFSAIEMSYET